MKDVNIDHSPIPVPANLLLKRVECLGPVEGEAERSAVRAGAAHPPAAPAVAPAAAAGRAEHGHQAPLDAAPAAGELEMTRPAAARVTEPAPADRAAHQPPLQPLQVPEGRGEVGRLVSLALEHVVARLEVHPPHVQLDGEVEPLQRPGEEEQSHHAGLRLEVVPVGPDVDGDGVGPVLQKLDLPRSHHEGVERVERPASRVSRLNLNTLHAGEVKVAGSVGPQLALVQKKQVFNIT